MKPYEFLDHTADIKFRAYGKSKNDVFARCAQAVGHVLAQGGHVAITKTVSIEVQGKDDESLLYKFIDELLYLLDAKHFVVVDASVSISNAILRAEIHGDDSENYTDLDHVKAATFAEMYVKKTAKGWEAQVVLDV